MTIKRKNVGDFTLVANTVTGEIDIILNIYYYYAGIKKHRKIVFPHKFSYEPNALKLFNSLVDLSEEDILKQIAKWQDRYYVVV